MISVGIEVTNVEQGRKDHVHTQIDGDESHEKKFCEKIPLHPYSSASFIHSDASGNASIVDVSISATDYDERSYGYDSDNLLNSGYAASVSEVTSNISSMGGFDESENDDAEYLTAAEELSIRPPGWQKRSVAPLETSKENEKKHPDADNASISSFFSWRVKRRKNRTHSRGARKGTIASEFRDFLGWDSPGDELNNITHKTMGKFDSVEISSTPGQCNVSLDGPVGEQPVEGVLTRWSNWSVPCLVVGNGVSRNNEEDVSTINETRFGTENFPTVDGISLDDVDFKTEKVTGCSGGKFGFFFLAIIFTSILTLLALIVVVLIQR